MSNCEGCGYLIPNESTCPNCSRSTQNESNPAANKPDSIQEFVHRRAVHNKNSVKVMCVRMSFGFFGLLGAAGPFAGRMLRGAFRRGIDSAPTSLANTSENLSGITPAGESLLMTLGVAAIVLFVLVTIYLWVEKNMESLFPTALCCPGCDERLDKLNINYDQCPSCLVQLT